tara:strand:- start:461 stop:658 length:198 start_codon:yes stop_codon:yes gene_type:complete
MQEGVISHQIDRYRLRGHTRPRRLIFSKLSYILGKNAKMRGLRILQQTIEKCDYLLELIEAELKA